MSSKQRNSRSSFSPAVVLDMLREARKEVPAMKYAFAAIALVTAAGLLVFLYPGVRLEIVAPLFLILMVLLVVFARIAFTKSGTLRWPAMFLIWSLTVLFVVVAFLAASSVALGWPEKMRTFILGEKEPPPKSSRIGVIRTKVTTQLKRKEPLDYVEEIDLRGNVGIITRRIGAPEGYEWDPSFTPQVARISATSAECARANIDSPTVLLVQANIGIHASGFKIIPGFVRCRVTARLYRLALEPMIQDLPLRALHTGHKTRIPLPPGVTAYLLTIEREDAPEDFLSDALPEGEAANVVRRGDMLIVTPYTSTHSGSSKIADKSH